MDADQDDLVTVEAPVCAHNNKYVLETKTRIDGSVRRRYQCRDCGERWSVVTEGERPPLARLKRPLKRCPRKLTLRQVYRILTERQTSNPVFASKFGVSHQAIQQIRSGATWRHVFPELPRGIDRRSCTQCKHWKSEECAIGFPDPLEEGPGFAVDCDFYEV